MMGVRESSGIKEMPRGKKVTFVFNGTELTGHEGEPIGVTLVAERAICSCLDDRPCNSFCKIGACRECIMLVNGQEQNGVCFKPIEMDMVVQLM